MNTIAYINNTPITISGIHGYEKYFKGIRFNSIEQFNTTIKCAKECFDLLTNGILMKNSTYIMQAQFLQKKLEETLCNIDPETYYGYIEVYDNREDISNYEETSYI